MKNIRITFRLSPYQLARGLQTIRQLEPSYKLISLNDIVKTIYHDYLAKMTLNRLEEVPADITAEITQFLDNPARKQITLEELIDLKPEPTSAKIELGSEATPDGVQPSEQELEVDLSDEILAEINKVSALTKASKFDDPNLSDSDISSITDFSPPTDWKK